MHRYLSLELMKGMAQRTGAKRGDLLILVADEPKVASAALDALRREMAARLDLADPNAAACCFVVDFPLFEWSESEKRWDAVHHPFTAPKDEDLPLLDTDPGKARSKAYDLVCNGWEMRRRQHPDPPPRGAGEGLRPAGHRARRRRRTASATCWRRSSTARRRTAASPPASTARSPFFTGEPNIREVIAFPKTKSAYDPMTGAPSPVSPKQLEELGIAITKSTEVIAPVEGAPQADLQIGIAKSNRSMATTGAATCQRLSVSGQEIGSKENGAP